MASNDAVLEELDVIKSIYCEPGELDVYFTGADSDDVKVIKKLLVDCPGSCGGLKLIMTLHLPSGYPDIAPEISLSGQGFRNEVLTEAKDALKISLAGLVGQPMLMNLIMQLQEFVSSATLTGRIFCTPCIQCSPRKQEMVTNIPKQESPLWTALLQIDHMRSKPSYVKTLSRWTKELGLNGFLLFCDWLILLLLQGNDKDIQELIVRLRTVSVDVDSHGRSCKERMATVLAGPQHLTNNIDKRFLTFSVINHSHRKAVEELFNEHGLEKLYVDHINLLKKK